MAWNYEDIDPDWKKPPEWNGLRFMLITVSVVWFASWLAMTALG